MRDILTSPRVIEIKRKRRALKIKLAVLFIALFIFIVWALSFLSGVKNIAIDKIAITGTHIVDQVEIEAQIRKDLEGKYLFIFSRNNSLIYPHNKIKENLLLKFPRIELLSLYLDNLNTLRIDITERKGSYLYCGANIPENKNEIGENCYFMNNDGFIFDEAPYFSGNVYFKYYMALDANIDNPLGKQMINSEEFHKLAGFVDFIVSLGFNPIYITVDRDGINNLYLNHGANDTTPKIIFKNNDNWEILKENLSLSVKKKEFINEIVSKYSKLLYIDLRFDNKVLYKFE